MMLFCSRFLGPGDSTALFQMPGSSGWSYWETLHSLAFKQPGQLRFGKLFEGTCASWVKMIFFICFLLR